MDDEYGDVVVILNCPGCFKPLTSTTGEKLDLLATPCGHLFHEKCLPKPVLPPIKRKTRSTAPEPVHIGRYKCANVLQKNCNQFYAICSKCLSCQETYNKCIPCFPTIADSDDVEIPSPPLIPPLMALRDDQEIDCCHEDCFESGQLNHFLVEDYNALVIKLEELDVQIETEQGETDRLKKEETAK